MFSCGKTFSKTFNCGSLRGIFYAYYICVCKGRGCKIVAGAGQYWCYVFGKMFQEISEHSRKLTVSQIDMRWIEGIPES